MSESEVKLLNSPYGEVTYESFRKLKRAFADKSAMIKSLDDNGMLMNRFASSKELLPIKAQ